MYIISMYIVVIVIYVYPFRDNPKNMTDGVFVCSACGIEFTRMSNLHRHTERSCRYVPSNDPLSQNVFGVEETQFLLNPNVVSPPLRIVDVSEFLDDNMDLDSECVNKEVPDCSIHDAESHRGDKTCDGLGSTSSGQNRSCANFDTIDDDLSVDVLTCESSINESTKENSAKNVSRTEVKLLDLLEEYNVPHSLYDKLMNWAAEGVSENFNFADACSRKQLLSRLHRHYSDEEDVTMCTYLHNGLNPELPVYHFSFKYNIQRLLKDEFLMKESLWSFNHDSGYGELNSGSWWNHAENEYLRDKLERNNIDSTNHYICPIIVFDDKTHVTDKGTITAQPVLISIGNINMEKRKSANAWFLQGLIPTNPLSPAEQKEYNKGTGCRTTKLKNYHESLRIILSELFAMQRADLYGEGHMFYVAGVGDV